MCVRDVDVQCVLQFTLINAAGCALHRRTSRAIHRLELCFACVERRVRCVQLSFTVGRLRVDECERRLFFNDRRSETGRAAWVGARRAGTGSRRGAGALAYRRSSIRETQADTETLASSKSDGLSDGCTRREGATCANGNDPSAGSPTETLLRLLLPLDHRVRSSLQRRTRARTHA